MMYTILHIIGLACLTNLLIEATPIKILKDKIGILEKNAKYSIIKNLLIELLYCPLCLGFWIGIFYMYNSGSVLLYSAIVSILSEAINRFLNK